MGQRSSFQLVPMAIAALEQLLEWRVPRIAATLTEVTATLAERTSALGLGPVGADRRGPHMLGITLPDALRARVPDALAAANCFAGVRGSSLRIAPHLHTTPEDIERLIAVLGRVVGR